MDDALQRRLDAIERRQRLALLLLVYPYLVGGTWLVVESPVVAVAAPALALVVVTYLVVLVRARTGTDETGGRDATAE